MAAVPAATGASVAVVAAAGAASSTAPQLGDDNPAQLGTAGMAGNATAVALHAQPPGTTSAGTAVVQPAGNGRPTVLGPGSLTKLEATGAGTTSRVKGGVEGGAGAGAVGPPSVVMSVLEQHGVRGQGKHHEGRHGCRAWCSTVGAVVWYLQLHSHPWLRVMYNVDPRVTRSEQVMLLMTVTVRACCGPLQAQRGSVAAAVVVW